jgi:hypothetical protein
MNVAESQRLPLLCEWQIAALKGLKKSLLH